MIFKDEIEKLRYIVKDETKVGETRIERYPDDSLIHWWNLGQRRMSTMRPIKAFMQASARDKIEKAQWQKGLLRIPEDCYRLIRVFDDSRGSRARTIVPIYKIDSVMKGNVSGDYCFVNSGALVFSGAIPDLITMYYDAYYPDIINLDSEVRVPDWSIEALEVYVMMKVAEKEAIADSRYRKFITKVDAGTPINNPFLQNAEYFLRRFTDIIKAHSDDSGEDLE